MIQSLFPIPLGVYDLDREIKSNEISAIKSLKYYANQGNQTSENIADYCKEAYSITNKVEMYITQSWANHTKPTEWHHAHKHSNSIVSGVFYIETNDDDKISFLQANSMNPIVTYYHLPFQDYTAYNGATWWMPSIKGRLYLFPSILEHEVAKVEGNKDRWSISFNTFMRGELGEKMSLTHLVI